MKTTTTTTKISRSITSLPTLASTSPSTTTTTALSTSISNSSTINLCVVRANEWAKLVDGNDETVDETTTTTTTLAGEAATKNGMAELAKRVPPNQALKFKDFQAKHAEYRARVNKHPEKLPNIDWEFYKRNVRADFVKMVGEFEQKYKGVCECFDQREKQDKSKYFVEIDRLKKQVQDEVEKYKAASNERIKALEANYAQIQALIPYEEMTAEEYAELLPDKSFFRYKGEPSFWPHTEDEQGPGPSIKDAHGHDDDGHGGGSHDGGHNGHGGDNAGGSTTSSISKAAAKLPSQSDAVTQTEQPAKPPPVEKVEKRGEPAKKKIVKSENAGLDSPCFESPQFKHDLDKLKKCFEETDKKTKDSTDKEKKATSNVTKNIKADLKYPVHSAKDMTKATDIETERLDRTLKAHTSFGKEEAVANRASLLKQNESEVKKLPKQTTVIRNRLVKSAEKSTQAIDLSVSSKSTLNKVEQKKDLPDLAKYIEEVAEEKKNKPTMTVDFAKIDEIRNSSVFKPFMPIKPNDLKSQPTSGLSKALGSTERTAVKGIQVELVGSTEIIIETEFSIPEVEQVQRPLKKAETIFVKISESAATEDLKTNLISRNESIESARDTIIKERVQTLNTISAKPTTFKATAPKLSSTAYRFSTEELKAKNVSSSDVTDLAGVTPVKVEPFETIAKPAKFTAFSSPRIAALKEKKEDLKGSIKIFQPVSPKKPKSEPDKLIKATVEEPKVTSFRAKPATNAKAAVLVNTAPKQTTGFIIITTDEENVTKTNPVVSVTNAAQAISSGTSDKVTFKSVQPKFFSPAKKSKPSEHTEAKVEVPQISLKTAAPIVFSPKQEPKKSITKEETKSTIAGVTDVKVEPPQTALKVFSPKVLDVKKRSENNNSTGIIEVNQPTQIKPPSKNMEAKVASSTASTKPMEKVEFEKPTKNASNKTSTERNEKSTGFTIVTESVSVKSFPAEPRQTNIKPVHAKTEESTLKVESENIIVKPNLINASNKSASGKSEVKATSFTLINEPDPVKSLKSDQSTKLIDSNLVSSTLTAASFSERSKSVEEKQSPALSVNPNIKADEIKTPQTESTKTNLKAGAPVQDKTDNIGFKNTQEKLSSPGYIQTIVKTKPTAPSNKTKPVDVLSQKVKPVQTDVKSADLKDLKLQVTTSTKTADSKDFKEQVINSTKITDSKDQANLKTKESTLEKPKDLETISSQKNEHIQSKIEPVKPMISATETSSLKVVKSKEIDSFKTVEQTITSNAKEIPTQVTLKTMQSTSASTTEKEFAKSLKEEVVQITKKTETAFSGEAPPKAAESNSSTKKSINLMTNEIVSEKVADNSEPVKSISKTAESISKVSESKTIITNEMTGEIEAAGAKQILSILKAAVSKKEGDSKTKVIFIDDFMKPVKGTEQKFKPIKAVLKSAEQTAISSTEIFSELIEKNKNASKQDKQAQGILKPLDNAPHVCENKKGLKSKITELGIKAKEPIVKSRNVEQDEANKSAKVTNTSTNEESFKVVKNPAESTLVSAVMGGLQVKVITSSEFFDSIGFNKQKVQTQAQSSSAKSDNASDTSNEAEERSPNIEMAKSNAKAAKSNASKTKPGNEFTNETVATNKIALKNLQTKMENAGEKKAPAVGGTKTEALKMSATNNPKIEPTQAPFKGFTLVGLPETIDVSDSEVKPNELFEADLVHGHGHEEFSESSLKKDESNEVSSIKPAKAIKAES